MKTFNAETQKSVSTQEALQLLKDGNQRFINGIKADRNLLNQVSETNAGQWPFATVLSCIDSRLPAETIFDQGIGDIFSIRIAGNFINEDILGSMEFATKVAGSKVVVVLGHTSCGALKGSLDAAAIDQTPMNNLSSMVHKFDDSIDKVIKDGEEKSSSNTDLLDRLTVQNVNDTMENIRKQSTTIQELEANNDIIIVGGVYDVKDGKVTWL